MNKLVRSYFFIPSGFKEYIENGFEGWGFLYFLYLIISVLLAHEAAPNLKAGIYIFLQPMVILILLAILSTICALILGAKEPLIKGLRLTAICLPPIALTIYFIAKKSLFIFFAAYPVLIFIYGSAFLGSKNWIINSVLGMVTIILAITASYFISVTSDKWFGQELVFDGFRAELTDLPSFSRNEARVYKFLLLSTPDLGHIPQADELADSLKMDRGRIQDALVKLDERGYILLGADREIRYAYPWAMYNQGYEVMIEKEPGSGFTEPIYAASALHALAATGLFKDAKIRIISQLRDTHERLFIELTKGQIGLTNYPQTQVYNSDIYSEIEFYSSPSGAKASCPGRFDSTRLLSLDRAVTVANELIQNNTTGLF